MTQHSGARAARDGVTSAGASDQQDETDGTGTRATGGQQERQDAAEQGRERQARAAEGAARAAAGERSGRETGTVAEPGQEPARAPEEAPAPDADVLAADVARLEDRWRRTLADLDNLRKRCAREVERERALERGRVAGAWLPIVDNLELALAHADGDAEAVIEGIRAVRDQAVGLLARLGFPRHDEVGVPFDPARHEAVAVVDATDQADESPGAVVRVMRPETRVGRALLEGDVRDGAMVRVDARDGELIVTYDNPPAAEEPAAREEQEPRSERPAGGRALSERSGPA